EAQRRLAASIALMLALPLLLGAGEQAPKTPPHDPAVYGRRLECRKVEGIDACMAVEVVGDRLYAAGGGHHGAGSPSTAWRTVWAGYYAAVVR
ncbi:MAG: hypothetical protein U1E05_09855, partial [Patescibacteria group bacterium]|nr:hypothetical protein [Patescibacteria group bacterium]